MNKTCPSIRGFLIQQRAPAWLFAGILAVAGNCETSAAEWGAFRGPSHDGSTPETVRSNWSEEPPRVLWRVSMRNGFSSFSVSEDRAFTLVERRVGSNDSEMCVALNAATGQELWAASVDTADQYDGTGISGATGPRSTPVVDGGRVYVLSAYLNLVCFDAATGNRVWSHDLISEYGSAQPIPWQSAAAPVVEGDLVLIMGRVPGQNIMAFRKGDGALAWSRHNDGMTHATPTVTTLNGVRQVLFYAQSGLVSLAPTTGDVLWRHAFNYNGTSAGASPVLADNLIYCSRAYPGSTTSARAGAIVVQLNYDNGRFSTAMKWRKVNQLMNHWATPVHHGGFVYGIYGQYNSGGSSVDLKCVDLSNGEEKWTRSLSGEGSRSGGIVKVADKLLLLTETGDLVLFKPNPASFSQVARFSALQGKCWNVPAVSGGRVYARSTTEAVCVDLAPPAPPVLAPLKTSIAKSGDTVEVRVSRSDDSALDAATASRIRILESLDLAGPWTKLLTDPALANGVLKVQKPFPAGETKRFFKAEQIPQ